MELIKGIVVLLVILSILVIVHEWGHFIVAKLFKMRVEEFSLFFGKVLVRLGVRHGTEYNIRAVPLGGFVRIAGMDADDISGGRPILQAIRDPIFNDAESMDKVLEEVYSHSGGDIDTTKIADSTREAVQSAIGPDGKLTEPGLQELEALKLSPRIMRDEHKLIDLVLLAHARATDPALYNKKPIYQRALVIFAGPFMSLLFGYLLFCIMGMTIGIPTDKPTNQVQIVPDGGPAKSAGLLTGDRIVAIDGMPTPDGLSMINKIHASAGKPLRLTIQRSNETLTKVVTPKAFHFKENGKEQTIGRIGVLPIPSYVRQGPVRSIVAGTMQSWIYVNALVKTLFSRQVREQVGGPIAMAQMATANQRLGILGMLNMAAIFSLSLGVINLLPIPILDGGHLLLLSIEKVRRRKLSPREIYRAQMVGLGLLALIVTFVMYNDIVRTLYGKSVQ